MGSPDISIMPVLDKDMDDGDVPVFRYSDDDVVSTLHRGSVSDCHTSKV